MLAIKQCIIIIIIIIIIVGSSKSVFDIDLLHHYIHTLYICLFDKIN